MLPIIKLIKIGQQGVKKPADQGLPTGLQTDK